MKTHAPEAHCYEFFFSHLDTLVEVEDTPSGIVIRTSRDTFSAERRRAFVRELVAEGFIGGEYLWEPVTGAKGVRWIIDAASFMPGPACVAATRRVMLWWFLGATVLWLGLMSWVIFFRPAR